MADKEIDVKALFDGVIKSLQDSITAPPWQQKRDTGEWPDKRSTELELLGQQLVAQKADSRVEVEARFSERRDDIRGVVEERKRRIEAYAGRDRQVIPAEDDKFIIAGRITDQETGVGLPNVKVNAFDLDRKQHDFLGNARTDSLGYFRVEYTEEDFLDSGEEKQPETFIEVMGEDGEVIHTSTRSFVQKAGEVEFVKVEVDGHTVPGSLDAGQRVDESVKSRIDGLATRERLLSSGEASFLPADLVTATRAPLARATSEAKSRVTGKSGTVESADKPGGTQGGKASTSVAPASGTAVSAAAGAQTRTEAKLKPKPVTKAKTKATTKAKTKASTKTGAKAKTRAKPSAKTRAAASSDTGAAAEAGTPKKTGAAAGSAKRKTPGKSSRSKKTRS